jgi:hypothetical protein
MQKPPAYSIKHTVIWFQRSEKETMTIGIHVEDLCDVSSRTFGAHERNGLTSNEVVHLEATFV